MRLLVSLTCAALVFACSLTAAASEPESAAKPAPVPARHRASEAMIATGGAVLGVGTILQIVGGASWYANHLERLRYPDNHWWNPVPYVELGIGLGFATIGTVFLCVGFKQRKAWKAQLGQDARFQLAPTFGPRLAGFGVLGRF